MHPQGIIGVGRSVFTLRVDGKNNAESDEWLRRVQDAKTLLKLADLDEVQRLKVQWMMRPEERHVVFVFSTASIVVSN